MIELINIKGFSFTIVNVVLVVVTWLIVFYLKRKSNKKTEAFLKKYNWNLGKENILNKLVNQVLVMLGVLFTIAFLGIGNKEFSVTGMLDYKLFGSSEPDHFKVTIGSIILIALIVYITKLVLSLTKTLIYKSTKDKEWIDESRQYIISRLTTYFIYVLVFFIILKSLNVDVTQLLIASSGILIGFGLALQIIFKDIISGFILLFDGTIKIGDILEIEGKMVKVVQINIRTSYVKNLDSKIIVVPNSKLTEHKVINWTISEKETRFNIKVGVAYGSDTKLVQDLLYKAALEHSKVSKNKAIQIIFEDFGESSLDFQLYFWTAQTWEIVIIRSELRFRIDQLFREHNVQIPFPQRDLHLVSDKR